MERIIPLVRPNERGPTVANLQDALLFIVERRQLRPDGLSVAEWQQRLAPEISAQSFGEHTTRVFAAVREALQLPSSDFIDEATASRLNRVLEELGAFEFVIRVEVRQPNGGPFAGALVRALDQDLRSRQPLGNEVRTDDDGRGVIRYQPAQGARAEVKTVDLTFEVLTSGGAPLELRRLLRVVEGREQPVAILPVIFNAEPEEQVILIAGDGEIRRPSEFERLTTTLTPPAQGIAFAELTEDAVHRDVTFLNRETGEDFRRISLFIKAHGLALRTRLAPDVFYGLFREGLPTVLSALVAAPRAAQHRGLLRAIAENIISPSFGPQVESILARLEELRVELSLEPPPGASRATLTQIVATILPDRVLQAAFLSAYVKHSGSVTDFWEGLRTQPQLSAHVDDLKFAVQLGTLTGNHLPLVQELQRMQRTGEIRTLADLARLSEDDWVDLLARPGSSGPIGVPDGTPGADATARARTYARAMAHIVEDAFPTAVVIHRLAQDSLPWKDDVLTFLRANPDYNLRGDRFDRFIQSKPGALDGVADAAEARKRIKAVQRLYRLAPRYAQVSTLLHAGVESAHAIARMGRRFFTRTFGPDLGGAGQAWGIHTSAQQTAAMGSHITIDFGPNTGKAPTSAVPDPVILEVEGVPEWSALFGSLELCSCQHCRSTYSPAAYLVDVLHWLSDRQSRIAGRSAEDVLFSRRRELGEIELTCENTNTPLPYVDLVNEVLENAVAPPDPFAPFVLVPPPGVELLDLEADLNGRRVSESLVSAFAPPLSPDAVISVGNQGKPWKLDRAWWSVDEPEFTYTVRKENGQLSVVSRSLQTKGTAAERMASPQYLNRGSYETLRTRIHPWTLPFDLWLEMARAYLLHLGVGRAQLMETFSPAEQIDVVNDPVIGREHLGLSSVDAAIITGVTASDVDLPSPGAWNLWGFDTEQLGTTSSIPDPADSTQRIASGHWLAAIAGRVDVLLQQSGLSYLDLLDLLGSYFINPVVNAGRAIHIVSTDPAMPDTCALNKLSLQGLDEAAAMRIVRFVRLWRKTGWTVRDLDRAITAFQPVAIDTFITRVAHVERLRAQLNVPVVRLLAWWAGLDTALYIDHRSSGQPLLSTLYAQLFRNRAVRNPLDPAFTEDPIDLTGTLSDRQETIRAALGLRAADFTALLGDGRVIPKSASDPTLPDDTLSLANLSRLHRHATLAKAVKLRIPDYLRAIGLADNDPFASTAETVLFVNNVSIVRDSGFTVEELDYLLRHQFSATSSLAPRDETIGEVLTEIRAGLQTIAAENTYSDDPGDPGGATNDPSGDVTRQKLALLNWDLSIIERVTSTLNGTVIYNVTLDPFPAGVELPNVPDTFGVPLTALPVGFIFPAVLAGVVSHDANADRLVAARVLSPAERSVLQEAAAAAADPIFDAAVQSLFQLQDELHGTITYDADTHTLRFKGPMTLIRHDRLLSVSQDAPYQDAIDALFAQPRTFVSREMRTFSVHDFATELTELPVDLQVPKAFRGKVYFDAKNDPHALHFVGVMTETERDALLALSNDQPYRDAVDALFVAPDQFQPEPFDVFLTATGADDDASAMFDAAVPPETRFLRVLQKLLPYLRRRLSEGLVVERLAESLSIDGPIASALLTRWVASPVDDSTPDPALKRRAIEEFLDEPFAESDPNLRVVAKSFPSQFKTYTRLHKIATLVTRFAVKNPALAWLFEYGPDVGWLDLNLLPIDAETPPASFHQWLRLADLFRLRSVLSRGELLLDQIFALARTPGAAAEDLLQKLSELSGWDSTDVTQLVGPQGFGFTLPVAFHDERALIRLQRAFANVRRLGMSAAECRALAQSDVTQHQAFGVMQAVRAKYEEEQWLAIAKPLRDVLREKQRAALVAYLVPRLELPLTSWDPTHPQLSLNDTGPAVKELQQKLNASGVHPAIVVDGEFNTATRDATIAFQQARQLLANGIVGPATWAALDEVRRNLRDVNDLYSHFLIDVEMSSCMMTSRIKQAISSTQLFVQRCLMNLELEVAAGADQDDAWLWWKWMKNYRVWEANRKVFLYPENWIEPELREDKSPFFKELEGTLLQGDVTKESAESALLAYLAKLDQVSRLEPIGVHHQIEHTGSGNAAVNTLHVFARKAGTPPVYFYRRRAEGEWTAWQRVDADIEGNHLVPVVWGRRLFVFWPTLLKKSEPAALAIKQGTMSGNEVKAYWEVRLAWSEYRQSKWTSRRVSSQFVPLTKKNVADAQEDLEFWMKENPDADELPLVIRSHVDEDDNLRIVVPQWGFSPFSPVPAGYAAFLFNGANANPSIDRVNKSVFSSLLQRVEHTGASGMFLEEMSAAIEPNQVDPSEDMLFLPAPNDSVALESTPGTFRLLPHADGASFRECPFFFLDDARVFFVVPSKGTPGLTVTDTVLADAGAGIDLAGKYVLIASESLDPAGPVINPGDASKFEHTYTVKTMTDAASLKGAPDYTMKGLSASWGEPYALSTPNAQNAFTWKEWIGDQVTQTSASPTLSMTSGYKFHTFYHPYVSALVRELNLNGVDGLLQRDLQRHPQNYLPNAPSTPSSGFDFEDTYDPQNVVVKPYPGEAIDFEWVGAYSQYNWEIFFHVPWLIADRLSKNQRFEEAQRWFHYIFDPTDASGQPAPKRFWQTKKFFDTTEEEYQKQRIEQILHLLAKGGDPSATLSPQEQVDLAELEMLVRKWRKYPFQPHMIARLRTTAYQKAIVMKYLDNLIGWGDQLFRRDTLESINEATQLYILAAELLGRRPQEVPPRAIPRVQTYNSLKPGLGAFSDALVEIEEFISPSAGNADVVNTGDDPPPPPTMLFFCIPANDKLLGYWDTVADRLFKIRHCMNIDGVVRQLPLFEPPIDPALLVKAAAAGLDLGSVLNDLHGALPSCRFSVLVQKATELCAEVKALGAALLSALEKKDAEKLALLRTGHEVALLGLVEQVKQGQVEEAKQNLVALRKSREIAVAKLLHYQKLLAVQSPQVPPEGQNVPDQPASSRAAILDESGSKMIGHEKEELERLKAAHDDQSTAADFDLLANIAHYVPMIAAKPFGVGVEFGGQHIGPALAAIANRYRADSADESHKGTRASKLGQIVMRAHEWTLQSNVAAREIMHIDQQIAAAQIREGIAGRELENQRKQIEHAKEADAFMRDKYTNQELYGWMVGQVSGVYFQAYQLAYDVAKKAERAYRYEIGLKDSSFIQFGYWDSLQRGLLAGDKLHHDVKRMELAYLEENKREYEITKHVSLTQLDPLALIQLKQTGECFVTLPEALFDLDYAGHFMRRMKSAGLTIPCVTGPYTSVNCTLTLLKSSIRHGNTLFGGQYARLAEEEDPRFVDSAGAIQSIVTSSGQNDSGLFEANARDERYLPFEGAGVISDWRIELARDFKAFDYDTISDVILHIRYTSRDAGGLLKQKAATELLTAVNELGRSNGPVGPIRAFSLRHEFSSKWHQFLNSAPGTSGDQTLTVPLHQDRFPFLFWEKTITFDAIELIAKVKGDVVGELTESLKLSVEPGTAASQSPVVIAPWNGLLRGASPNTGGPGDWTLTGWLESDGEHQPLTSQILEDIFVVCHFTCS